MPVTEWTGREARLLRKALRMSVRGFGARLGISPRTVSKWEELGVGRTPIPEYQAMLDTALSQASPEAQGLFSAMLTAGDERPETEESPGDLPAVLAEVVGDSETSELILSADHRAQRFLMQALNNVANGESMDHLWTETTNLATDYQRLPARAYASRLVEMQKTCYDLLDRPGSVTTTKQILILSALTGGILAKVALDLGQRRSSQVQIRAAYVSADNADHPQLRAWIRGLQSVMAYWEGRYVEARDYAARGQALEARSTASVWLAANEARAAAALGDASATRAAIRKADEARLGVTENEIDSIGGLCIFSPTRQTYYTADALAALPEQVGDASARAEAAVSAYRDEEATDWAFGDAAGSSATLALVHVRSHDVHAAAEQLAPVLELPVERRIEGVTRSVARVYGELRTVPDSPSVQQLRTDIEDFMRLTAETVSA
ncbi:MAG: helix-turn-helix domain-containing protein [Kineosporiaceae bacterium]